MIILTRRGFLKATSSLVGLSFVPPFMNAKTKPLLSFSTLGCPDWSFDKILEFAVQHGYQGIEIRGIQRELDLTKCAEFNSKENISATKKRVKEKGLEIVDLGSSTELHHEDVATRQKHLDEGKKFIDLAQQLGCPYIRVFPNKLPKDKEKQATLDLIAKGLKELGDYAKGSHVTVLMETHGDVVLTEDIKKIIQSADGPNTGLVWDIVNMWSITKESPSACYNELKKYIRHTHIKDAKLSDGKLQYVALGKGDTPIMEAIDLLSKNGYKGYYSFEWEKLWHPEIEEPETALADYPLAIKKHIG